jgi:hypothetical protein
MLNGFMLSVVILDVIVQSVIMLSVVMPLIANLWNRMRTLKNKRACDIHN